jgi:hypothetical protein
MLHYILSIVIYWIVLCYIIYCQLCYIKLKKLVKSYHIMSKYIVLYSIILYFISSWRLSQSIVHSAVNYRNLQLRLLDGFLTFLQASDGMCCHHSCQGAFIQGWWKNTCLKFQAYNIIQLLKLKCLYVSIIRRISKENEGSLEVKLPTLDKCSHTLEKTQKIQYREKAERRITCMKK